MTTSPSTAEPPAGERADLLATLAAHRRFLTIPARDLTDRQAGTRSTISELTIGGLIKHVSQVEDTWARFITEGPAAFPAPGPEGYAAHAAGFRMEPGETLGSLLQAYREVAGRTDDLVRTVDLDSDRPLPQAPWFPPNTRWTARRVFLHIIAETAQHAGHADIIREAIDGSKSMG